MIGLPLARRASRLLPLARDEATLFLPWILALMVYVAATGGIALLVLQSTLHAAEGSLTATLTVQLPADASTLRLETIMAVLRRTKGVTSAHLFEPAETRRLLEPWFGPNVPLDELPVPRLIDVQIDPAAEPDLATLRRQLASVVPEARLDDHRALFGAIRSTGMWIDVVVAAAIVAALALIAAATMFAVRAVLRIEESEVEVVHLLGAPDVDLAGQLALRYLWLGLIGGAGGAAAALLTVAALTGSGAVLQLPAPSGASGIADWRFWAIAVGAAAVAGAIAMASARIAVLRWLARLP